MYNVLGPNYSFNLRNVLSLSFENYLDHLHLVLFIKANKSISNYTFKKMLCYLVQNIFPELMCLTFWGGCGTLGTYRHDSRSRLLGVGFEAYICFYFWLEISI